MMKKIVGVFASEQDATNAIEELKRQGYSIDNISVVGRNKEHMDAMNEETGTKAPEGVASGAATGGIVGGLTGLLAGIGALAIPGIGPIVAAGPIAAALAGAAVGAGAGGLVGGLIGLGIPENEAKEYGSYVEHDRILVLVDANEAQRADIYRIFQEHHALNSKNFGLTDAHHSNTAIHRETGVPQTGMETRETAGTFYQEIPPEGGDHSVNERDEDWDEQDYRRSRDRRQDRRFW
ncbi:general stress protein [Paenibacillus bouchesdurhonensis]|uniref:general stress protein n=1 Tax=Paenibacillus bouchesdurhonensis TaxID=1870990 RepID=UPI000DA6025C|nr:general stress protein [Paenibacillus bouchesdurhonensis]